MTAARARTAVGPRARRRAAAPAGAVAHVHRAERRKLWAQLGTRLAALTCVAGPAAFAVILAIQGNVPADTLFGLWVHRSGLAVPMVVLGFAGTWGFAVLAGVAAGDSFSAEDRYGTWKTVLTRSCSRRDLFWGKVLAVSGLALTLVAAAALSSLISALLLVGAQPLVNLSGATVPSAHGLLLVALCWLTSVLPVLGFVSLAILCSVASRNGIIGVLGPVLAALAMMLLGLVGSGWWLHTWLLASAFDAWHGLMASPSYLRPLLLASVVSLAWIIVCLGGAWLILTRRDFAGAPARSGGWGRAVSVALGGVALLAALAAVASMGPPAVTAARLEAAIRPTFNNLTLLQQRLLGRHVPAGARLNDTAGCVRRSGQTQGPGDDWICTLNMLTALAGPNPFALTPVAFDVTVKANGCYKADGPPSFIGQPQLRSAGGTMVVNPLYSFAGCFDPTG